jgi:hypothetical protein
LVAKARDDNHDNAFRACYGVIHANHVTCRAKHRKQTRRKLPLAVYGRYVCLTTERAVITYLARALQPGAEHAVARMKNIEVWLHM